MAIFLMKSQSVLPLLKFGVVPCGIIICGAIIPSTALFSSHLVIFRHPYFTHMKSTYGNVYFYGFNTVFHSYEVYLWKCLLLWIQHVIFFTSTICIIHLKKIFLPLDSEKIL
jgi:hypothetical protein